MPNNGDVETEFSIFLEDGWRDAEWITNRLEELTNGFEEAIRTLEQCKSDASRVQRADAQYDESDLDDLVSAVESIDGDAGYAVDAARAVIDGK